MPFAAGDVLELDQKAAGLYAYLAVPGGFQTQKWLGSGSTDLRNGMGTPMVKGSRLQALRTFPNISTESVARRLSSEPQTHIGECKAHFDLFRGPQFDAFSPEAAQLLIASQWIVSTRSDRTGYRLEGSKLAVPDSIPSEPVLPGSFQVPGSGQPIITMADGPTVGGYPKIAVLKASDLDRLAQCAPGTKLTFAWVD
jgi:allophanate hydrolase subunit 2